jgi:hypothetical protein
MTLALTCGSERVLLATRDRRASGRVVQSAQQLRRSGDLGWRPVTGPEGLQVLAILSG